MMHLTTFLFGNQRLWVAAEDRRAVMELCLQNSIVYRDFQWSPDGGVTFVCAYTTARRLRRLCREAGIVLRVTAMGGLPVLFYRHRKRVGLWVGSLLAMALVVLSQQFVWDIRVTGNQSMTRTQVLEELRACGFSVGSYLPDVQAPKLENQVLLSSDKIAWISVNLEGTVANVQIIERTAPPSKESSKPANLIATADGQIEMLELYRGNSVVKVGQAVRKGDLLVSGLYDSQTMGYRYTRAAGKVLARTERVYRVEIPLVYEEKLYEDAKCGEILLNFFDFSIKIYKSTGNWGSSCDIIEKEKGFDLFFGSTLPLSLTRVEVLPYTVQAATRTPGQATRLAYAELERELARLATSAQLLEKRITATLTEDALILDCTVKCIEDIARQVEFEIRD